MLPDDRLICAFVSPQEVGKTFERWLLHVTVVPWFRLADNSAMVAQGLERALVSIIPFEVSFDETALFGPSKNRPALLIKRPTPFDDIEPKVRNYLHKKRAWLVDETTKRRYRFRPHVTLQKEAEISLGEVFRCDRLYIVEQKGQYKEIVSEIKFGE